MAEVPREIMNHLRAKMYYDRHQVSPEQQDTTSVTEETAPKIEQANIVEENRLKKALSRLSLRSTEPELLGD